MNKFFERRVRGAHILVIPMLCTALLCGCRHTSNTLTIVADGGADKTLAFYEISATDGAILIDSVRLDNNGCGHVSIPKKETQTIYALQGAGAQNLLVIIGKPSRIKTCYDNLVDCAEAEPKGDTPLQSCLTRQKRLAGAEAEMNRIGRIWTENCYSTPNADSLHADCIRQTDSLHEVLKQEAIALCKTNTDNLLPVFIANRQTGPKILFDLENPADLMFLLDCAYRMQANMPDNPHVERMVFNLERAAHYQKNNE